MSKNNYANLIHHCSKVPCSIFFSLLSPLKYRNEDDSYFACVAELNVTGSLGSQKSLTGWILMIPLMSIMLTTSISFIVIDRHNHLWESYKKNTAFTFRIVNIV